MIEFHPDLVCTEYQLSKGLMSRLFSFYIAIKMNLLANIGTNFLFNINFPTLSDIPQTYQMCNNKNFNIQFRRLGMLGDFP